MVIRNAIDQKLKTPMTRKEFLGQAGMLFLGLIGITSVLHSIGIHDKPADSRNPIEHAGYGTSAYGG
jgi:hypothetical protein